MRASHPSLIQGLDPAALFDMSVEEPRAKDWQPPSLEQIAVLFPQWEVRRMLGRGGMGVVYEMRQPELDRVVAVKLLPLVASQDEHLVERFRREARALAKLRHPGIVALWESGLSPAGHLFFVMEHVNGSPLSQWIAEGRLDVPKAIEIVRQVCEALAYAHAQGVIHRDIKPSNILLDAEGHAKVADFGLARLEQAQAAGALDVSHTGQFMGTPAYAAPEQVKDAAHVDHRADIYALGVLLYEMLTGDLPRGVFQPPSRKTSGAAHLDEVVRRAMQERPEDRYQAAAEMEEDVSRPVKNGRGWLWVVGGVLVVAGVWFGLVGEGTKGIQRTEVTAKAPPAPPTLTPPPPPSPTPPPSAPLTATNLPLPPTLPPPPIPAKLSRIHAWSLEPVSPSLQPPTALTQQPWKDAILTAAGGAVLHPDGSIFTWDEKTPNVAEKHASTAIALASSQNELFMLDAENRLHRLGDEKTLAEGLTALFSDWKAGSLLALTSENEALELEITSGSRRSLGKLPGEVKRLTRLSDGTLWAVLSSHELLKHDGQTFSQTTQSAADLQSGSGWTLTVEETGRCLLHGDQIPDSPQRFRLPEGTQSIRFGPQARMVAW